MQNQSFETKRTTEGTVDIRYYARIAVAERRAARANAMKKFYRSMITGAAAFISFWNIPPKGSTGANEMPYR